MHTIQNQDVNVGPANYKRLAPDQLLVTSIFYTIQGEGPYAGYPAMFVRLAGCNRGAKVGMGCEFCDTAFQYINGKTMTFAEIAFDMLNKLDPRKTINKPLVVITGGEPMMQDNLVAFCTYLNAGPWPFIQIESNGDRLVPGFPANHIAALVVSPKVSKVAGQPGVFEYKEPNPDVFDRADYFKFVVEDDTLSPYYRLPSWADICARQVYVSPLTHYTRAVQPGEVPTTWNHRLVDVPRTRANYCHAVQLAMKHGYRISLQQHLMYGVP